MSIHQLAHHLQSAGRGEDKVLVHMTPREVNGLQALAMAHGGSLTINPKTGLPEAGFLSSILPMVAGFFLGPAGLGIASSALGAGAMVGAATGIATGSLTKGLMAGLGAYGGFGLADSLAAAGASAAGTGANAANAANAANVANATNATNAANLAATGPSAVIPSASNVVGGGASTLTGSGALGGAQTASLNQSLMQGPFAGTGVSAAQSPAIVAANQIPSATQVALQPPVSVMQGGAGTVAEKAAIAQQQAAQQAAAAKAAATPATNWENVKSGFKDVTSSGDKAWNFIKKNPTPFIGAGLGLLSEFSNSGSSSSGAKKQPGMMRPYEYSVAQNQAAYAPSASTAERIYFDEPRFIAKEPFAAKAGGLMALAEGGATLALPDRPPIEQATQQQAIGQNNSYPMANQRSPAYSAPTNRPLMQEVVDPSGGPEVDSYTGEPRFASGGAAASKKEPTTSSKYSYDPTTMQYTETTTTTPTKNQSFDGISIAGMGAFNPAFSNLTLRGMGSGANIPLANIAALMGFNPQTQKPTVTTETLGGVSTPYVPQGQAAAAQTPAPATNIPQYQTPEQQLGLEGFYNMMGDQLAMKGAQMQAQGFASGGVAKFGGGGTLQFTPEGQAKQDYLKSKGMAGQNGPRGIMRTIDDDEWARIKKENNISIPSAASAAPTYNYNPQNMQFTDNAGKVSGGVQAQFMPMPLMAPAQPEQALGMPGYQGYATGGMAEGGYNLGGYSDGGRLLKGPGDGVSDSIPASIGNRQPARLADGEFVVPARIVSEIGNGSTEAGARKLYAMMDRVQKARKKTVGKNQVAKNTKAEKLLPA